jgi:hypothetical protein
MTTERSAWREGIIVGLIAYVAVAVFYAAFDFLAARGSLYTVNVLGLAVFRGLRDPGVLTLPSPPDWTAIFWYNGLHLVLSLLIGLVVMRLVAAAERQPSERALILFILVAGYLVTVLGVGYLSGPLRPVLPWWSIVVANLLASLAAAVYVVRRHPGITDRLLGL